MLNPPKKKCAFWRPITQNVSFIPIARISLPACLHNVGLHPGWPRQAGKKLQSNGFNAFKKVLKLEKKNPTVSPIKQGNRPFQQMILFLTNPIHPHLVGASQSQDSAFDPQNASSAQRVSRSLSLRFSLRFRFRLASPGELRAARLHKSDSACCRKRVGSSHEAFLQLKRTKGPAKIPNHRRGQRKKCQKS